MAAIQRTLSIVKPDAVEKGVGGEILGRIFSSQFLLALLALAGILALAGVLVWLF